MSFVPPEKLLDPQAVAEIECFVSINSAVEVDRYRQVDAERAAGPDVGALGGHGVFVRTVRHSPAGFSVIALPSLTRDGRSRIVPVLEDGWVTTPQSDIDYIVTEHGIVELAPSPLDTRPARLATLADPRFSPEILADPQVVS